MPRIRKKAISVVEDDKFEETEQDKKNFEIIQAALMENGPSYRMVQLLAKSIRPGYTPGQTVVRQLLYILMDIQDLKKGIVAKSNKKSKKLAIHTLMKLNKKAFKGIEDLIRKAFLHNMDDYDIGLGVALLMQSHFRNAETTEWIKKNIDVDQVWEAVYYNITTGAFVWDDSAIAFKGQEPVFAGLYPHLMKASDIRKFKIVLTNSPWLDSSLAAMSKGSNAAMLKAILDRIGNIMDEETINDVADILREVNGWSVKQFRGKNDDLKATFGKGFYPGVLTFTSIDVKIPDVLLEIDDVSVLGYSFRKYMQYLAARTKNIRESKDYPDAETLRLAVVDVLSDIDDLVKSHKNYARHFESIFLSVSE